MYKGAMADEMAIAPGVEYERRLKERRRTEAYFDRWEQALGNARVVVFLAAAGLAWFVFGAGTVHSAWLAAPVVVLIALSIGHDRVNRRRGRARRAGAFYEK